MWVLPRTDVPFILRCPRSGEYVLIGEAYVHIVMDGESMSREPAEAVPGMQMITLASRR